MDRTEHGGAGMTIEPRKDDPLFADAARLGADAHAEIDDALAHAIPPGLADVLMRARKIAPDRFDDDRVAEATALDELDDDRAEAAGHFGALGTFVADARAYADAVAEHAVPDAAAPASIRRGPARRVTVALVALAAVAILVPAVRWVFSAIVLDPAAEPAYSSASDRVETTADPEAARFAEPPAREPSRGATAMPEPPPPEEPEPLDAIETVLDTPPASTPKKRAKGPSTPSNSSTPSKEDALREIDAQARAAWAKGDLPTAEAKFGELVRAGGRSTLADIAYGDLFSVLRQRGRADRLPALWRRYASRFPEGRYIDEARAGLCRTAGPEDEVECWRAYLRDRPRGTYRQHARDIVERGG
jgi:hypothetical protein